MSDNGENPIGFSPADYLTIAIKTKGFFDCPISHTA